MSVYDVTGLAHGNTLSTALQDGMRTQSIIDSYDYRNQRKDDREHQLKQREWQEQDRVLNRRNAAEDRSYTLDQRELQGEQQAEDRTYELGQREHRGTVQAEELRQMKHNRDVVEPLQMERDKEDRAYQLETRGEERKSRQHTRKIQQLEIAHKQGEIGTNSLNRQVAQLNINEKKAAAYDRKAQKAVTQLDRLVKGRSTDKKLIDKVTKDVEEILGADLGNPGELVEKVNKAVGMLKEGAPLDHPEMQEVMAMAMTPDMIRSGRQGNFKNPRVLANPNKPNRYVTEFDYPDGKKTGYATIAQGVEGDEVASEYGRIDAMQSLLEYKRLVGNIAALNINAVTGTGSADIDAKYNQHTGEYYSGKTGESIRSAPPINGGGATGRGRAGAASGVDLDVRVNDATGEYYSSTTGEIINQGEGAQASERPNKATLDYFDDAEDIDGSYIAKQLGSEASVGEVNAIKKIAAKEGMDPDTAIQSHRNTQTMQALERDVLAADEYKDIPKRQKKTIIETAAETLEPGQSIGAAVKDRLDERLNFIQTTRKTKQLLKDTGKDTETKKLPRHERQRIIQSAVRDGVEDMGEVKQLMIDRLKEYDPEKEAIDSIMMMRTGGTQ